MAKYRQKLQQAGLLVSLRIGAVVLPGESFLRDQPSRWLGQSWGKRNRPVVSLCLSDSVAPIHHGIDKRSIAQKLASSQFEFRNCPSFRPFRVSPARSDERTICCINLRRNQRTTVAYQGNAKFRMGTLRNRNGVATGGAGTDKHNANDSERKLKKKLHAQPNAGIERRRSRPPRMIC